MPVFWSQPAPAHLAEDYTSSAPGMGGDVPVTVSYEDGRITAVTVGENNETPGIGDQAINAIPRAASWRSRAWTADTVAGATVTSNAILTAAEALSRPAAWI